MHQALSVAKRNKTKVALMFIDLDKSKDVNDSLGHAVGDQLLQQVAARMRLCTRVWAGLESVIRALSDQPAQ